MIKLFEKKKKKKEKPAKEKKEEPKKEKEEKEPKKESKDEFEEISFDDVVGESSGEPKKVPEKKKKELEAKVKKKAAKEEKGREETKKDKEKKEPKEPKPADVGFGSGGDIGSMEVREGLSAIYALLERQNKILEKMSGNVEEQTHKSISVEDMDEIDQRLVELLEEKGDMQAKKLQDSVHRRKICSLSTLYLHLKKLVNSGLIKKERRKKKVYYYLPKKE